MLKRVEFTAAALAMVIAASAQSQVPAPSTPLTMDPKVTIGKLPNGLTYYIRQNAKPEKRAELRLVVNVGSIQEDDDQKGYAHFVEHMGFNGTKNFKKNELTEYLQSIGLEFGADLNAYTSFDETVYQLTIPTDTARIVDKAFQVLADWAYGQLFDSTMVVTERGVVLEEWRGGKGAGQRMSDKATPIILAGSRYAIRSPIGNDTSIMAANPGALRRYYEKWYRPDLMAIVAVGDFDKTTIESLIRNHFKDMKPAANPAPRIAATVPPNKEPLIAITTDKEMTSSYVSISFKRPWEANRTVGDYRRGLIESMYLSMINNRLYEPTRKPNAPYRNASMGFGGYYARDLEAFDLGASVNDGGMERGLEAILIEVRRADEFGFLQTELDRVKTNMLRGSERSLLERDTRTHGTYVGSYVNNFLYGTVPLGIEYTNPLLKELLPTITLAEVNGLATKWISDENRVVSASSPEKPGLKVPTGAELLAVFARAARTPVTAYTEAVLDGPLVANLPRPGRVTASRTVAEIGVTEWQLSNGSRVLLKKTDFKNDEILFTGSAEGGYSALDTADYHSLINASSVVASSGAGQYSAIDLGKKLTGKVAGAGASMGAYSHSVSGSAAPKDLETMFELLYLRLTQPRIDTASWLAVKERAVQSIQNRDKNPSSAFSDTIVLTMSQYHPRAYPLKIETLDSVDLGRALALYKQRFADFTGFTYAFVGNIDTTVLKPLVEKYLASLPAAGKKDKWRAFSSSPPPTGVIEKTVQKGLEQQAITQFIFTGPFTSTADSRFILGALINVMRIKLTDVLREQYANTYGVSVGGGGGKIPREEYSLSVGFGSSTANAAKLSQAVLAVIDTIQRNGPSAADVEKVKEQYARSRESSVKLNGFWLGTIASREETSVDSIAINMRLAEERSKNLSPDQIREAAKLYFNLKNYAKFTWIPEISQ